MTNVRQMVRTELDRGCAEHVGVTRMNTWLGHSQRGFSVYSGTSTVNVANGSAARYGELARVPTRQSPNVSIYPANASRTPSRVSPYISSE